MKNITNVLEYLEHSAEHFPDKPAYIDAKSSYTFSELERAARAVGSALCGVVQKGCPVAVYMEKSVQQIAAFFGTVYAGAFYAPIDVDMPAQRTTLILDTLKAEIVISDRESSEKLHEMNYSGDVILFDEISGTAIDDSKLAAVRQSATDADPLYIIFTSGSTGIPKGVLISHRSVIDFIPVFAETFDFSANEVFGNQAPFDFDVSVKDIYSTLYCGASMFIIPKVCFSIPKKLIDVLIERKVTAIIWAVTALCIVSGFNAFTYRVPDDLKKILFSGEVMPVKMLNVWRKALPDATYVNLYGPTEVTCNCMYYIVDREFENTDRLPLGVPFQNEKVLILNEKNESIKAGEIGEICVAGSCLALGYYRNTERTQAVFVQNPLNDRYSELIYRTGDMAELSPSGEYYFAARKDFQIKHMGHRIELEEIETYIDAVDGVTRASCLFDAVHNKIVAYYTGGADKLQVIESLKKSLPKYMIPNIFIQADSLPISKNGKIDRQKLRVSYEMRE